MFERLAAPARDLAALLRRIDALAVAAIDERAAALRATARIESRFVTPGEDPLSASLDFARTVVRRAERRVGRARRGGGTQLML